MIHVFHGFLGSPVDFQFLQGPEVILHDLSELDLNNFMPSPEDTLIGYSMGGRVAMELASRVEYKLKRLVLINAHPGLENEVEKLARKTWEKMIEDRMESGDFISYWNSLPVFTHDLPLGEKNDEELKRAQSVFRTFRLSDQKNYLPELDQHKEKILWLIGDRDDKYREMAENRLRPLGIPFLLLPGGHRLFQRPEVLKRALIEKGIL